MEILLHENSVNHDKMINKKGRVGQTGYINIFWNVVAEAISRLYFALTFLKGQLIIQIFSKGTYIYALQFSCSFKLIKFDIAEIPTNYF